MSGTLTTRTAASRPQDWLLRQLPAGMLGEDFFIRFVSLFQAEADTLLEHADAVENLADLQVAPISMVRFMAQWIGAPGIDAALPDAEMRALVHATARAVRVRGTLTGLRIMVEAFTGADVTIEESGGVFRLGRAPLSPGWVRIRVSSSGKLPASSLVDLVRDEIPAHLNVELWIGDEQVWATPGWVPDGTLGDGAVRSGSVGHGSVGHGSGGPGPVAHGSVGHGSVGPGSVAPSSVGQGPVQPDSVGHGSVGHGPAGSVVRRSAMNPPHSAGAGAQQPQADDTAGKEGSQ